MKDRFPEYYRPTPAEFAQKFKECVFAFDTNVLLNLYRYTPESRDNVIANLKKIRERVWMPHQVGLEYQRNRIGELLTRQGLVDKLNAEINKAIAGVRNLGRSSMLFASNSLVMPAIAKLESIQKEISEKKEEKIDLMHGDSVSTR